MIKRFDHLTIVVDDINAIVQTMRHSGYTTRNGIVEFHARKLVFLVGPGGTTIELSQWD